MRSTMTNYDEDPSEMDRTINNNDKMSLFEDEHSYEEETEEKQTIAQYMNNKECMEDQTGDMVGFSNRHGYHYENGKQNIQYRTDHDLNYKNDTEQALTNFNSSANYNTSTNYGKHVTTNYDRPFTTNYDKHVRTNYHKHVTTDYVTSTNYNTSTSHGKHVTTNYDQRFTDQPSTNYDKNSSNNYDKHVPTNYDKHISTNYVTSTNYDRPAQNNYDQRFTDQPSTNYDKNSSTHYNTSTNYDKHVTAKMGKSSVNTDNSYFHGKGSHNSDCSAKSHGPTSALLSLTPHLTSTQRQKVPVLDDMVVVRTIGTGTFGRVFLVRYQGRHYALKRVLKRHLCRNKQLDNLYQEKKALTDLFFSRYFVKLIHCFKNESAYFFLMEYIAGGELFFWLRKYGTFLLPAVRFYAAEIVLALEYLFERGLIYRDLKPENILLTTTGHIKLIDLGFAKRIKSGNTGRGNTGNGNTGSGNTGRGNAGSGNTGNGNTGRGKGEYLTGNRFGGEQHSDRGCDKHYHGQYDSNTTNSTNSSNTNSSTNNKYRIKGGPSGNDSKYQLGSAQYEQTGQGCIPPKASGTYANDHQSSTTNSYCYGGDLTYTMCGTAEYMAPEKLLGTGYGMASDVWTLGILMYEMLMGRGPFIDESDKNLYKKILYEEIEYGRMDLIARDLISQLLIKEPINRLCNIHIIKEHLFFKGIFHYIDECVPPIIPHLQDEGDSSYFMKYNDQDYLEYEGEEVEKLFYSFD